ncbi:MAG TPA: hypothetical protein VEB60_00275, partial [Candidatus Paceibacterota bacterium]|nr:hypothetical protein [Candidatus Paceibacterota bacterium]
PALAHGLGGGNFLIKLPRGAKVFAREAVIEASSTAAMMGRVGDIAADPSDPFQEVRFRSPFNVFTIRWVEIYGS